MSSTLISELKDCIQPIYWTLLAIEEV